MLTILLFHLWQRTGSDHLLFSSVVEADRRFRDCARRRFQRRIQRATWLCRCHLYLRCSFSGLWLFWNRQTFSLWYRIACNLIFNQSRCSWRIFRRNCRPGFIDFPNLFIGRFRGGYAICYLSKWTKMSINSIINWKWRNIFTLSIPREGFATFEGFLGIKRSLMTTSEPFVRSLKMTEYFLLFLWRVNVATSSLSLVTSLNLVLDWEATEDSTPWRKQWNACGGVWTKSLSISFTKTLSMSSTTVPKSTNWTSTFSFLTLVIFALYQSLSFLTTQAIPICGSTTASVNSYKRNNKN